MPIVNLNPAGPKSLAATAGAMHAKPIGFPSSCDLRKNVSSSVSTVRLLESNAKLVRFLAAPNPPGEMTAS